MMSNNENWMNRTAPKDHHLDGMSEEYGVAQWFNGIEGADGPLGHGGIELPFRYFKDMLAGQSIEIPHRNGTVKELGYLLSVMSLCIVQSHTAYSLTDNAGQIIAWSSVPRFEEHYRSKTSYFCYAAEIERSKRLTPFVLSVKSKIAKEFKALLRQFRSQILATANEISGSQCPHYFFYIPVGSTGRVFYPNAAVPHSVAPPVPYWDIQIADLDPEKQRDAIDELAIPDYLYDHIQAHGMDEANAWRETMENRGNNDTPPPQGPSSSPAPAPPPATAAEMELERQQQLERERQQDARPRTPLAGRLNDIQPGDPQHHERVNYEENWEGRNDAPMTEAQAVEHAHNNDAGELLAQEEARKKWQENIGQAIATGLDFNSAGELAAKAKAGGDWISILPYLNEQQF